MQRFDFVYCTHARLPTEKAHGIQMVQTVHAVAGQSLSVLLLVAKQPNPISADIFSYYDISKKNFEVREVGAVTIFRERRVGYWIRSITFSFLSALYLLVHLPKVLYSREPFPLIFFSFLPTCTVYEMHDFPVSHHWFHALLCRRVSKLVTTNEWAKEQCVARYHIAPEKILVAPNGYNASLFRDEAQAYSTRELLQLPAQGKLVVYTGNLFEWKGVHVLLEAMKHMPDTTCVIVGGDSRVQEKLKERFPGTHIIWRTHVPQREVVRYLSVADVLVLPNVPTVQHSIYSTSPIKLFEYMAMGKPVVASDLPSIRSIVSDTYVTYCEPGSPEELARTLLEVFSEYDTYTEKAKRAQEYVRRFLWSERGRHIVAFVYNR